MDLIEKDYFGLRYVDENKQRVCITIISKLYLYVMCLIDFCRFTRNVFTSFMFMMLHILVLHTSSISDVFKYYSMFHIVTSPSKLVHAIICFSSLSNLS